MKIIRALLDTGDVSCYIACSIAALAKDMQDAERLLYHPTRNEKERILLRVGTKMAGCGYIVQHWLNEEFVFNEHMKPSLTPS